MTLEQLRSWRAACLKAGDEACHPDLAKLAYQLAVSISNAMSSYTDYATDELIRNSFHPHEGP